MESYQLMFKHESYTITLCPQKLFVEIKSNNSPCQQHSVFSKKKIVRKWTRKFNNGYWQSVADPGQAFGEAVK